MVKLKVDEKVWALKSLFSVEAVVVDSCSSQNRNIKVALDVMNFIQQEDCPIKTIDHNFMVSGQSVMPNDADFGVIEQLRKEELCLCQMIGIMPFQNSNGKSHSR
ncbi:unnamed protein product [Psylliodes chrysocephalus]|uniref:Uncharacterized protein n=1 Tax=Psylliodes chrysocephalus TaxID=3402493 RepID=A0A9P0D5J1_9CUCU|nr:unnamed protein product [Psylliodes chrysocephala]